MREQAESAPPLVTFRTLNGFAVWPIDLSPGEHLTEALRIRRLFHVRAPGGEGRRTAVDVTTSVQQRIFAAIRTELASNDPLWDEICRHLLANWLWRTARVPSETLVIYELTADELGYVRRVAGLPWTT